MVDLFTSGPDRTQLGQSVLYPLDDPSVAFNNALQDMGINPFRSNPFTAQLQKTSGASRIAFLADAAQRGGNMLSTPSYSNPSMAYGNFLKSNLQGGNYMGNLGGTARNFPSLLQTVRDYESQLASGQNTAQINPYTAALRDIFAADNGKGALGAYGSLQSAALGPLASSYSRALSNVGDSAVRNFAQRGSMDDDVWKWMFPAGSMF